MADQRFLTERAARLFLSHQIYKTAGRRAPVEGALGSWKVIARDFRAALEGLVG